MVLPTEGGFIWNNSMERLRAAWDKLEAAAETILVEERSATLAEQ